MRFLSEIELGKFWSAKLDGRNLETMMFMTKIVNVMENYFGYFYTFL